ncbi:NADPH:quinone oxidoreductase [Sphingobium sp. TA15]|uniref:NADPH2:quinone reductase n=1 Tax=Sphingobium indicum (strain DSM 16413 / CCM 7287 / MTCC 6362 / UT26 / NBRC 101211 / UT26S) TaxID=452662 RepID=D4Z8F4_SPHIU|nr:NADPH:quinone oxidoreductase family protein [Sphingobium indicum]BAI98773.1 NADPH2:quinone reductase [Sphingobium indicum UT26S]BDD68820.1 NADPH:quinone oxidoreductase [Sphingobium sp. TA15]
MKAVISREAGGPDTLLLEDVPDPRPAAGEVVIDVKACGVNFPDVLIINDQYQFKPSRPFSPGGEVAGIVSEVGEGVDPALIGQRVIGLVGWGGMAERVATSAGKLVPIPDSMPFDEAAAFIATYGTSYHALKQRARLAPGESVLVLGAAGGVGLAAVELATAMGARVFAAASSEEKLNVARARGAGTCILYPGDVPGVPEMRDLAEQFRAPVGAEGYDVILDIVGGNYSEPALRTIAWKGRFLVVGFPAGIAKMPLNLALLKGCDIAGVFYGLFTEKEPDENRRNNAELFEIYEAGRIRPHISARFGLDEAARALDLLAGRQAQGKIVVTVG